MMIDPPEFEALSDDEKAATRICAHIQESWISLIAFKSKDGSLDGFLDGWASGRYCVQIDRDALTVIENLDGGDETPDDVSGA
jgi:hypothetical protein